MAGANVLELSEANFQSEVLESELPVLVDFWAPWCGPCRTIGPVVEQLADELGGQAKIGKVNVDEAQALAVKYNVRSIPNILVFKDGKVAGQQVGVCDKSTLVQLLGL